MKKEISKLVIPNKKINFFVFTILILGFLSGCLFITIISKADKTSIIEQITLYFSNINKNTNNGLALNNILLINYLYIIIIWILGLSVIGIILNIFIIYTKGFIVGFTLSSMMLTYKVKGITSSLIYLLFGQLINIIIIIFIGIYAVMFSINLFKLIINRNSTKNIRMLKKYIVMLCICLIITFISSIIEYFILPNILKLVIKLYI